MSQQGSGPSSKSSRPLAQAARSLIAIQALYFIGAGLHHAYDMWQGGWLPYDPAPLPVNVFWTSLTALDLLAAGLLLWRPRAGLILALLIMLADVGVNSYMEYYSLRSGYWYEVPLQLQSLFLGFVAGAAPMIWKEKG